MLDNFKFGLKAIIDNIDLSMTTLFFNKGLWGFFLGVIIAVLITGWIITKNPRHIPLILRYSSVDAFEKMAKRRKNGTYEMAFTKFLKIYTEIRTLSLVSIICFFVMIITIVLTN